MKRRDFLGFSLAAAGLVFAPKFGRWHRQGSGLLVPRYHVLSPGFNPQPPYMVQGIDQWGAPAHLVIIRDAVTGKTLYHKRY